MIRRIPFNVPAPPPALAAASQCSALAAGAACCLRQPARKPKVLNIYNWSDYIADDTIKNFEKETGIKVRYDNYDNNEILHAKLVAGKTGYDIVVPGAHFAKMQIEGGLFQKLDRAQLHELGQPRPGAPGAAGQGRPGQPVPGRLAVGLRHGGHQRRQGEEGAGRPADAGEPLVADLRPASTPASSRAAASTCSTRPPRCCRWR